MHCRGARADRHRWRASGLHRRNSAESRACLARIPARYRRRAGGDAGRRQARATPGRLRLVGDAYRIRHSLARFRAHRRGPPHVARHGQGAFPRSRGRGPAQGRQGRAAHGSMAWRGQLRAQAALALETRLGAASRHRPQGRRRSAQRGRLCRGEESAGRTVADRTDDRRRERAAADRRSLHLRRRSRLQCLEPVGQRPERERAQRGARPVAAIVPPSRPRRSARARLRRAQELGRRGGRRLARAEPARVRARSRCQVLP